MYAQNTINRWALPLALLLSVVLHGWFLHLHSSAPIVVAHPQFKSGKSALHLTLAAPPQPKPKPKAQPKKVEQKKPLVKEKTEPLPKKKAILPPPVPKPISAPPKPKPVIKKSNPAEHSSPSKESTGTITSAKPQQTVAPRYPRLSRRRKEEGTVLLSIQIDASGNAQKITLSKSSGYKRLDRAAITAVKKTTFIPAKQAGENVPFTLQLPITFKLKND